MFRWKEKGQTMAEFALIMPILILLMFGMTFNAGQTGPRQVRSLIRVEDSRNWIFGIQLIEAQRAETNFRLWRFYPGPPPSGGFE